MTSTPPVNRRLESLFQTSYFCVYILKILPVIHQFLTAPALSASWSTPTGILLVTIRKSLHLRQQ